MKLLIIICWDYLPAINKKKNFIIIYNLFNECHMFNINIMFIVFFFFCFLQCNRMRAEYLCISVLGSSANGFLVATKTKQNATIYTILYFVQNKCQVASCRVLMRSVSSSPPRCILL